MRRKPFIYSKSKVNCKDRYKAHDMIQGIIQQIAQVCLMLSLSVVLTACGAKGDLVLPENVPEAAAQSSASGANEADKQKQRKTTDTVQDKE